MVRFYRDALGAEETTLHQVAGANVVRLKLGHTGLGVFDAKDVPGPGVPHHTFDFEGPRRVARLMREAGLRARVVKLYRRIPGLHAFSTSIPNRQLDRLATAPDQVWVGDITYVKIAAISPS